MNLWFVTMVKDEADVIGPWLRHAANQGATGVAILDNGSTDGTREIIEDLRSRLAGRLEVIVQDDPEVGYYQSVKVSRLSRWLGMGRNPDWIIPADADERWVAPVRLSEFFMGLRPTTHAVTAPELKHVSTALDDPSETDPFRRMRWYNPVPNPLPKVAYRWESTVKVEQGNHGVQMLHPVVTAQDTGLTVHHYQYRSPEHFITKARNGAAAYAAAPDLPADLGWHWREHGALLEQGGEEAARAWYQQHFYCQDPVRAGLLRD